MAKRPDPRAAKAGDVIVVVHCRCATQSPRGVRRSQRADWICASCGHRGVDGPTYVLGPSGFGRPAIPADVDLTPPGDSGLTPKLAEAGRIPSFA